MKYKRRRFTFVEGSIIALGVLIGAYACYAGLR